MHRYLFLICIALIFSLGLVMVFNTSSADVLDRLLTKHTHHALFRQIFYGVFACFIAVLVGFIGYHNLLKISPFLLCFFSFLLLAVFVPGIGKILNGARRWIGIGPYTLQPSEFIKFVIPLYYISFFLSLEKKRMDFHDFLKIMGILFIPTGLVFLEPDTGTTIIIGFTLLMLLVMTRVEKKFWVIPMLVVVLLGGIIAYNLPHVHSRVAVYLNPEMDKRGKGHQPYQAKIATGSGQLFGKGLGKSLQKLNYLPEAQNDYIAAIYAEEFGFLGMLFLLTLYMFIAYFGFYIAYFAADKEGFYLASVITYLICIQAFLNLGVVSGLLPSTGLNLPFFSQGGSSLVANIVSVAVLLNISTFSEKSKGRVYTRKY